MPRRRLRTFTLWTGTTLIVLIAAALVWTGATRGIRLAVPLVNTFAIVVVLTLLVWVWPKLSPEPIKPEHAARVPREIIHAPRSRTARIVRNLIAVFGLICVPSTGFFVRVGLAERSLA